MNSLIYWKIFGRKIYFNYLPIKSNAASITAAPFNIVAIRISCPGQSTNETWRVNVKRPGHEGRKHGNESSFDEPPEM